MSIDSIWNERHKVNSDRIVFIEPTILHDTDQRGFTLVDLEAGGWRIIPNPKETIRLPPAKEGRLRSLWHRFWTALAKGPGTEKDRMKNER